jgi:DNA processing protein
MRVRVPDTDDPPEVPRTGEIAGRCPPAPRVAVIGARAALRALVELVPAVVAGARRAGHAVVSGGALGVDAAVHRAALEQGVPQIAVLPLGSDRLYPPAHAELFAAIAAADGSAVVFPRPRGATPSRAAFASRNAVVVALARAVCVVQAEVPSGSLATARLALRRGRPVAVLAGSPAAAVLGAAGARVLRGDLADATAAWLEGRDDPATDVHRWPLHLQPLRVAVLAAGSRGATLDQLPDPLLAVALLGEAEALGLVTEVAPGRFAAVP